MASSSSSSSSHFPMPVHSFSVRLWLPESFNSILLELIEQEENKTTRGALSRCLDGLRSLAIPANALASKDVLSEASLSEMRLFQYRIRFGNGIDPFRSKSLCEMLYASTRLFDEEVWTENRGMLASMPPYCSACDIFGHTRENCKHYYGLARTEEGFLPQEHISGKYKLEKVGRRVNDVFSRVIDVESVHKKFLLAAPYVLNGRSRRVVSLEALMEFNQQHFT